MRGRSHDAVNVVTHYSFLLKCTGVNVHTASRRLLSVTLIVS